VDDGVAVILNAAPASEITQVLMLVYGLTPRERGVLQPVLAGASSKIIAAQIHISVEHRAGPSEGNFRQGRGAQPASVGGPAS
jgi:FixJ family two-component response regulator